MPEARGFPALDREGVALPSFRVESLAGLVFVSLDRDAPPLREWFGDVADRLETLGIAELKAEGPIVAEYPYNWKNLADNYLEGIKVTLAGTIRRPQSWWLFRNALRPTWGEPYTEIVARMRLAVRDAEEAARGHEAVIVSHQLPIWMARSDAEGRRLAHDPRRRQCNLASVTSLLLLGVFTVVNVACLVLRRDGRESMFRSPGVTPYLAAALTAFLIGPWVDRPGIVYQIAAVLLLIGVVLWAITWATNRGVRAKKTGFRDVDGLG